MALPTQELREGRPPAFTNGDDEGFSKNLTRPEVSARAFLAAYCDKLDEYPQLKNIEDIKL